MIRRRAPRTACGVRDGRTRSLPQSSVGRPSGVRAWPAIALCAALCFGWILPASAQDVPVGWQPLGGPPGRISYLCAVPKLPSARPDSAVRAGELAGGRDLFAVSVAGVRRYDDQTQWLDTGSFIRSDALYHSRDGGATWQPATNNLIPGAITALYADPITGAVYIGVQGSGYSSEQERGQRSGSSSLWRSHDRGAGPYDSVGAGWEPVPLEPQGLDVRRIVRNANGRHLFVGATAATGQPAAARPPHSYLYRSADDGKTWASLPLPEGLRAMDGGAGGAEAPSAAVLADLVPHPAEPDRLFLTTRSGDIFVSTDAGNTWTPMFTASGLADMIQLAISPDLPDTMLAVYRAGGSGANEGRLAIEQSRDGGKSWQRLPAPGLSPLAVPIALAALPGNVFLLGTESGAYRSADAGANWHLLEGLLSSGGTAAFVALPDSPNTVLAATGYGIFISRDSGALWQRHVAGVPFNSRIGGLLTDARQPQLIYAFPDTGAGAESALPSPAPPAMLRSTDGGRTWAGAALGLPGVAPTGWALDPNDPNIVLVSAGEYFFRSPDAGVTWSVTGLPSGGHGTLALAASDTRILYVGGASLLKSMDQGATWQEIAIPSGPTQEGGSAPGSVQGLAVDPADPERLWAGTDNGVYQSSDGGRSWREFGLPGRSVLWLTAVVDLGAGAGPTLYAGVFEDGVYRWDGQAQDWTAVSQGLPASSTIVAFLPDTRLPGTLWAGRDGGGIYRSTNRGESWSNVAAGVGDNLALSLALDYDAAQGAGTPARGVLAGMATSGVWAVRPNPPPSQALGAVDARIEIVWPHDGAPVTEAKLANVGLRLFRPGSLLQPACGWAPEVVVWQATDSDPAIPLERAEQRSVDGRPFPYWEVNDVDVSRANDPEHKLYFMVRTIGPVAATTIWAHAVDSRTYYPFPDMPSGIAVGDIEAVDARILVVWPHDGTGQSRPVKEATYANVAVALFEHGTRLSVPIGWEPPGLTLYGAWDHEVGSPLATTALRLERTAGAITYPVWEFDNIPVSRAAATDSPEQALGSVLYLWVMADGVETYPTVWAHGADARTFFPARDEPIQGCVP